MDDDTKPSEHEVGLLPEIEPEDTQGSALSSVIIVVCVVVACGLLGTLVSYRNELGLVPEGKVEPSVALSSSEGTATEKLVLSLLASRDGVGDDDVVQGFDLVAAACDPHKKVLKSPEALTQMSADDLSRTAFELDCSLPHLAVLRAIREKLTRSRPIAQTHISREKGSADSGSSADLRRMVENINDKVNKLYDKNEKGASTAVTATAPTSTCAPVVSVGQPAAVAEPLPAKKEPHVRLVYRLLPPFLPDHQRYFLQGPPRPWTERDNRSVPLLSTFVVRTDDGFVERLLHKIDFPVQRVLVVQDGPVDIRPAMAKIVADLEQKCVSGGACFVEEVLHVQNFRPTGCAGSWNTAYRLFPDEYFWMMMSNDVYFQPGQLELFHRQCSAIGLKDEQRIGSLAAKIQFPPASPYRQTYGLMGWCNTRELVRHVGLYDENFYPAYYEDDDYVLRMMIGGFHPKAVEVKAFHGRAEATGYESGTHLIADKIGAFFKARDAVSDNRGYLQRKWGEGFGGFSYEVYPFTTAGQNRWKSQCTTSRDFFCTPYGINGTDVSSWLFSQNRRLCIDEVALGKRDGPCKMTQPNMMATLIRPLPGWGVVDGNMELSG